MAALTVVQTDLTGDSKSYVAANAGGDTFDNDGRTVIHVKNTNAATRTVTIDSTQLCSFGVDHNPAVVIAATTGDEIIGPFAVSRFGSTVSLSYDAVTNLTIAAIRVPLA